MATYAYARVSSQDQNLTRQLDAFAAFGVPPACIYCDKKSGKNFDRKNYLKMIKKLKKGDLLVIKSIDRLGRNYDAIIFEWNRITNRIQADIVVIDMPLLDTRIKADNLMGKFISDIVLQVLSFVAENERTNIKQRQREGIAAAKLRGTRFGRPAKIYTEEFKSIVRRYKNNEITLAEALKLSKLKRSNFYYHVHKLDEEPNNFDGLTQQ